MFAISVDESLPSAAGLVTYQTLESRHMVGPTGEQLTCDVQEALPS
jgi:hypothetical protein